MPTNEKVIVWVIIGPFVLGLLWVIALSISVIALKVYSLIVNKD